MAGGGVDLCCHGKAAVYFCNPLAEVPRGEFTLCSPPGNVEEGKYCAERVKKQDSNTSNQLKCILSTQNLILIRSNGPEILLTCWKWNREVLRARWVFCSDASRVIIFRSVSVPLLFFFFYRTLMPYLFKLACS